MKCKKCGIEKPLTEEYFYRSNSHVCKECKREYAREYQRRPEAKKKVKIRYDKYMEEKNKRLSSEDKDEIIKKQRWRWQMYDRYGVMEEDYNNMLEDQNGVCKICGGNNGDRRLGVDHDHKTGKVRGLLCNSCNMLLGYAKENPFILIKAIKYLKSSKV